MTLTEWLERPGRSAHALHLTARVSMPTIARAKEGRATRASARKIARATGNRVTVDSMCAEYERARGIRAA